MSTLPYCSYVEEGAGITSEKILCQAAYASILKLKDVEIT